MESNTQSEATLSRLGRMTVAELVAELGRYPAEMPVMFSNYEGVLEPIICITTTKYKDNIRVVELS